MIEKISDQDVWSFLKQDGKPVVMYGMGDGADKIRKVMAEYDIPLSAIFASDNFVRGHSFHGFPVEKYSDICARYKEFHVVLAFAVHDAPMLSYLAQMDREHRVFAPDVPVAGEGLFTRAYIEEHDKELDAAFELLMDEESRQAFLQVLRFKVSGKISYLLHCQKEKELVYSQWIPLGEGERIVDLGAYDGDTVTEFVKASKGRYAHILAVEPDEKNFKKLKNNTREYPRVECLNLGAWREKGVLHFEKKAGRNSRLSGEGVEIPVDAVDHFAQGPVTLLKMDIEGSESEAIRGAEQTIRRDRPRLYLCAYHRNEDMFRLPLQIHSICPDYRFYFCHHPYLPAWESNFYGVIPTATPLW